MTHLFGMQFIFLAGFAVLGIVVVKVVATRIAPALALLVFGIATYAVVAALWVVLPRLVLLVARRMARMMLAPAVRAVTGAF